MICIVSRIFTSIYYIEDIDSLRFALSLKEFDITRLQPHFPGYVVFYFFSKVINLIIDSTGISFSIVGGTSVFLIIIYTLKICRIDLNSRIGVFCSLLIFFNPIIWIMSNRYMPDLLGLSISTVIIFYLLYENKNFHNLRIGFFLVGILAGIRLSYLPFMLVPFLFNIFKEKQRLRLLLSFFLGCVIWLIPLIFTTGIDSFFSSAIKHSRGHFTNFGGTIITDPDWALRSVNLFKGIWSDGFGGYWGGRSWQTIILSVSFLYILKLGFTALVKHHKFDESLKLLILSTIIYLGWIFFFQNVIYKSRHILPVLILIFVIVILGQKYIQNTNKISINIITGAYFLSLISISTHLALQHKQPNSISKLKDSISNLPSDATIISFPLINFYLKSHGLKNSFKNIEEVADLQNFNLENIENTFLVGNFISFDDMKYSFILDTVFFHNPYVNRMWAKIERYKILE